jgi:glyoxylase-like metal-dependent hydrolase (beta-lactamase superfamily II)
MTATGAALPAGVTVFERGWLSSNTVLFVGSGGAALVDSGYCTHARQTLELVEQALAGQSLDMLVNTHLHSDHCGGNAALQARYPALRTLIPPGRAAAVRSWDPVALTYAPIGQECPPFTFSEVLQPRSKVLLGEQWWEVHAAPGHDPHSLILFEPQTRTLLSADALWENGFGIVFPELEGEDGFNEVAATLDLIERLAPGTIIPGHGRVFTDVKGALVRARSRLDTFVRDPRRHAAHAAKVLLKFKLLELQRVALTDFLEWAEKTPYLLLIHDHFRPAAGVRQWIESLVDELDGSGALRVEAGIVFNA